MRPLLRQGVLLLAGARVAVVGRLRLGGGRDGDGRLGDFVGGRRGRRSPHCCWADFRARRDERVLASLTMLLALAFVLGEYGCSTDSSLSFLVSIWKVLAVLLFLAVLAMDARVGFAGARRLAASKKALCVIGLVAVMAVAMTLQMVLSSASRLQGHRPVPDVLRGALPWSCM